MKRALAHALLPVIVASLAAGALTSCASSPSAVPVQPTTTPVVMAPGTPALRVSAAAGPDVITLPYAIETVWSVMPVVFDSLRIPIAKVDPAIHVIGNDGYKVRQRLGKAPLSRFIDCGQAQIGPNADSYDVILTVVSQLSAASATSTTVTTSVLASAKPITYNQGYSQCSTKGAIETQVLSVLRTALAK